MRQHQNGDVLTTHNPTFYGLEFYAPVTDVLRPYLETELVVSTALRYLETMDGPSICDIGVGCGSILISILKNNANIVRAIGIDISDKAIEVAQINAKWHDVKVNIFQTDLVNGIRDNSFDLVVSNPPYCTSDTKLTIGPTISYDGGPSGLTIVDRLLGEVPRVLKPNGALIIEVDQGQSAYVQEKAKGLGIFRCIETTVDHNGFDRVIAMRRF